MLPLATPSFRTVPPEDSVPISPMLLRVGALIVRLEIVLPRPKKFPAKVVTGAAENVPQLDASILSASANLPLDPLMAARSLLVRTSV